MARTCDCKKTGRFRTWNFCPWCGSKIAEDRKWPQHPDSIIEVEETAHEVQQ